MIEYLYIDSRRLDQYYERISSPVKYDKVGEWIVELSFTGPKAGGTQSRHGRSPTTQEKIEEFLDHVDKQNLSTDTRPLIGSRIDYRKKPFIIETLSARRAQITRNDVLLGIWVSMGPDEQKNYANFPIGALYLIEDFRGDEDKPRTYSGYSSLYLLAEELLWLKDSAFGDPMASFRAKDDSARLFALDPVGTLQSMGAQIGPERRIRTVYRFRASCIELETRSGDFDSITTIGYPIVIEEA